MSQQQSSSPAQTYEEYFVPAIFVPWTRVLLDHAAPQRKEHVLDVACGTGIVARNVAPRVENDGRVVALDMSPEMLDVARAIPEPEGCTIEWIEGNATALPDGPFDLIVCQQGLQFFSDPVAALSEMRRLLKVGGRVALSVWQSFDFHVVYKNLLEATARQLGASLDTVAHAWSLGDADKLRSLFDAAGFRHVDVSQASLNVRFPTPDRFVELTILGGATTIPAFAELQDAERSSLIEKVKKETEGVLRKHREQDEVTFPMPAHIAVAND